jgi:arylsulfatase A-like enzyme
MLTRRALLAASACVPLVAQRTPRPNVLLIITDDQGYGDFSIHGNSHLKTPHMDSIGRDGVQFTQFQVCPVCSPTRASLMTGRYNYRTGVVDTYLGRSMMHGDEVTLPELLREAGYRTGIFGKWHLGDNYPMRPIDQGFEQALVCKGGGIGQPSDPPGNRYFDPVLQHSGKAGKFRGYCTDIFADHAIEFISRNRERPWFTYLATNAPHTPLEVDEKLAAPFRAMGLDDVTAKVYGMVANADAAIGRVLAKLRELKLESSTLVLFLTDNGPQQRNRYNAGMRGAKGTVYQGGIRVPLFLRWPAQVDGGRTIDRIAAHIDVLPTVLDACGIERRSSPPIDGRSLMPLLRGTPPSWPDRTLFTQWHRGDEPQIFRDCAARSQQFKLVNGKELYDLKMDPAESKDVSATRPEVAARLRGAYEAWFRDVSSTRGYAPPRIPLGSSHENPVTLTRQDWRGPRAGWDPNSVGFWEVEVAAAGRYEIELQFASLEGGGAAEFRLGSVRQSQRLKSGDSACRLAVTLERGPGRLEAEIAAGERVGGVHYVHARKL